MKVFRQLGIIFVFGFAGELIARYTPLTLPSTVSGMLLLLLALCARALKPEHIAETADFLSANMAFFLVPSAVRIMGSFDLIKPVLGKLLLIGLISTVVTFASTYCVVRLTQVLLSKVKRS